MSLIDHILDHNQPPIFVAELSGNHNQSFDTAKRLVKLAAENGAQAIKLQTYTPDSITLPSKAKEFIVSTGLWQGKSLYELYQKAATPYEWHKPLAKYASSLGVPLFSTPFDEASVDFIESEIEPELYKVSSFEVTHIPLLNRIGQTRKPVIISVGMADENEIEEAIDALETSGCREIVLLKCVNEYPSSYDGFHLRSMTSLASRFDCQIGLSDHTITSEVVLAATALGARYIEKHFTDDRSAGGIDAAFSLEPNELRILIDQVQKTHSALGSDRICGTEQDANQRQFRRSIYVAKPIARGDVLSIENLKIIRPAYGIHPKHWNEIIGKTASRDLLAYSPLKFGDWS